MKKQHYTIMSTKKCKTCSKPLKANLLANDPNAEYCYKCFRIHVQGKPPYHRPRMKRIEFNLPVHNLPKES